MSDGRMLTDWYVVDMDDGIVRREEAKAACLGWAITNLATSLRILPGKRKVGVLYEYFIGESRDDCKQVLIARGDAAAQSGFDIAQRPLYPYADKPHERVDREENEGS